jgi:hypothetical protein
MRNSNANHARMVRANELHTILHTTTNCSPPPCAAASCPAADGNRCLPILFSSSLLRLSTRYPFCNSLYLLLADDKRRLKRSSACFVGNICVKHALKPGVRQRLTVLRFAQKTPLFSSNLGIFGRQRRNPCPAAREIHDGSCAGNSLEIRVFYLALKEKDPFFVEHFSPTHLKRNVGGRDD